MKLDNNNNNNNKNKNKNKNNSNNNNLNFNSRKPSKHVKTLLGDPKKAIIKISVPMMIGMLVQTIYNLADGIWVSGLGPEALSAIGLFFPFFLGIIAIAAGIGVGASSAVSRKIGAKDIKGADNVAEHSILLALLSGVIITSIFLPFLKQIFSSMSKNPLTTELSVSYAKVLFWVSTIMIFNNIANGILRGEGDTKRTMYAMLTGSLLNIVLDPIFIYVLHFGVVGAAYATALSFFVTFILIFYWLFIKKDTFVKIKLKNFKYNPEILKDIFKVGIPSSLSQLAMSLAMFFINLIIVYVYGDRGIAIFTSSWRITMFGIVPLLGMAAGTTAVTGAAYGAKDFNKLKTSYHYAVKIGVIIETLVLIIVLIFAKQISYLFTYSQSSKVISSDLIKTLRIIILFIPFTPLGMLTSAMFQGIGHGLKSLILTFLRTLIGQIFFAWLFAVIFKLSIFGVWMGIVTGNVLSSFIGYSWGYFTLKKLKKEFVKV